MLAINSGIFSGPENSFPCNGRSHKHTRLKMVRCGRSSPARSSHSENHNQQNTGGSRHGRVLLVDPKSKKGLASQFFDVVEKLIVKLMHGSKQPNQYLSGLFAPVDEETPPQPNLLVKGHLPEGLNGQLVQILSLCLLLDITGVENMIPEKDRFKRNKDGDTAHNIFTEKHKELKESGEKWLKDTSGSCMLVAALIVTVAFTSAFTVPGGNISETTSGKIGTPVFLKENAFIVFALADALALLSAITSVLMFLAIFTSRYAEDDFLKTLPNKLILGLTTLFISMASVLVAFGASLFIVLGDRLTWVLIPIVVVSCVPVTLFGWLQLPLFFDMIRSTYWGTLFRGNTYISSL